MHDVARHAGVSQTTVSLVINNPEGSGIPEATQARVREAIRAVGYRTNRLARAMRLNRTDTLGFVADDIATTPFANLMIKGAQDAAWAQEKLLFIVNTGALEDPEHQAIERAAIGQLLEHQVDGIVYGAMYHRELGLPDSLRDARRVVLVDCSTGVTDVASVVPDELGAAYSATQHLLDHGHRRIAHVSIDHPGTTIMLRRAGYREALIDRQIAPDERLLVIDTATAEGGRRAMQRLHQLTNPPTAIFCFNDQVAMGIYQQAAALGIRIPDQLSVVGFDDQQLIAGELLPGLTTMRLPHYEMGRWAVRFLLDAEQEPVQETMDCPLVERGSVAAPPPRAIADAP